MLIDAEIARRVRVAHRFKVAKQVRRERAPAVPRPANCVSDPDYLTGVPAAAKWHFTHESMVPLGRYLPRFISACSLRTLTTQTTAADDLREAVFAFFEKRRAGPALTKRYPGLRAWKRKSNSPNSTAVSVNPMAPSRRGSPSGSTGTNGSPACASRVRSLS